MSKIKISLLALCLLCGCTDLVTTNIILAHGGGESNPIMALIQAWFGAWWFIPKIGFVCIVLLLLNRSNKIRHIAFVTAMLATPVLNNLLVIAGS